jgi:2-hydroxychromene-2-carboxylate isomerase
VPDAKKPSPTRASRVVERIAPRRDPRTVLLTRRLRKPPALELYYEPGDPHSELCAQLVPMLTERVRTDVHVRQVGESAPEDYPERERQRAYARTDAARIAPARGLQRGGQTPPLHPDPPEANAKRRKRLGHYLPAVWQFDGEWFWGVDRLDFLEARLRERDLLDGDAPLRTLDPAKAALPELPSPLPPLEFFYSFRSPYSYLAVLRMQAFADSWPSGVVVRPVLPMAMRSITINRAKRMYTLRDVKRIADKRGVPFGRVADPLGDGARRLLGAFPRAESTEQKLAFLVAAGRAVWSEGIDVGTDEGLRYVCERAGVDCVVDEDIDYAERNRLDLLEAGLWGVPCYRLGDAFTAWGQDRFWMLEELLRRATGAPAELAA